MSDYPHPYIMDSEKMDLKMARSLTEDNERLKEMIREFTRYHAHCFHARELLSCNINQIALGKPPHPYPNINVPGNCPDPI